MALMDLDHETHSLREATSITWLDFTKCIKVFSWNQWISPMKMRILVFEFVSFHAQRNGDALAMQIWALVSRCLVTMKEAPWRQVSEE